MARLCVGSALGPGPWPSAGLPAIPGMPLAWTATGAILRSISLDTEA